MDKANRTYQLGLYEKAMPSDLSWEEKLNLTKESGFDYLEMSIDETDAKLARLEWTKEERKAVVDAMWKTGVKINSICLSGHRKYPFGASDPNTQKRSLEIMQKAIDLASDLGVRLIQLAGYDVYVPNLVTGNGPYYTKRKSIAVYHCFNCNDYHTFLLMLHGCYLFNFSNWLVYMVLCRKRTKEKSRLFIRNFYTDCPLYYRNCMGAFFASIPAIRQGNRNY